MKKVNKLVKTIIVVILLIFAYLNEGFNKSTAKQEGARNQNSNTSQQYYKVVKVHDGDTLTVQNKQQTLKLRLFAIDSPELAQPFGKLARTRTSELTKSQDLEIKVVETDQYNRAISRVFLSDGQELNKILVSEGLAYWYRKFAEDREDLASAEANAKRAKLGVWSTKTTPPWVYRKSPEFRR